MRRRPERRNHVWSYDFCAERTYDGRPLRMLAVVDEFTRECLAIEVGRKLSSEDVLERLTELFVLRGIPDHIRSDNGPEFTAKRVREWLSGLGVKTLFIERGSPRENGYVESFIGKMRDELLNREVFYNWMKPRCWWSDGGRNTIESDLTTLWATGPRGHRATSSRPSLRFAFRRWLQD